MKTKVHLALAKGDFGVHPVVALTRQGLVSRVADWCRKNWGPEILDYPGPSASASAVVAIYFSKPGRELVTRELEV